MQARDVVAATKELLRERLLPRHCEAAVTGRIRYDYSIRFAREALKRLGLIKPKKVPGQWEITEAGRRAEEQGRVPTNSVEPTAPGQMDLFRRASGQARAPH